MLLSYVYVCLCVWFDCPYTVTWGKGVSLSLSVGRGCGTSDISYHHGDTLTTSTLAEWLTTQHPPIHPFIHPTTYLLTYPPIPVLSHPPTYRFFSSLPHLPTHLPIHPFLPSLSLCLTHLEFLSPLSLSLFHFHYLSVCDWFQLSLYFLHPPPPPLSTSLLYLTKILFISP